ncbi:hypothetical protein ACLQ2R_17230 [Streptosporangium sp. DT93]
MTVDKDEVLAVYRERVADLIHENALLTAAVNQLRREAAELQPAAPHAEG